MNARLDGEFREFMHARWPVMVRLAYGLTGDQGHAEDVAQAAFARAYASWPRVRRSGNPDAYVRQILVNENRNRFRKRRVPERLTGSLPESGLVDVEWTDSTQEYDEAPTQIQVGAVQADVSYVTVRLGNGAVLMLHPVTVSGTRAVAFAVPIRAEITDVTAYSRHGEIAFAVPFNWPGGTAWVISWLRPGQHQAARVPGLIGSGTVHGKAWSATAYLGPWGTCIALAGARAPGVAASSPFPRWPGSSRSITAALRR